MNYISFVNKVVYKNATQSISILAREKMNKIQKTSLFFRVLFQILFVVLPVLLIMAWVQSAGTFEMVEGVINLNYVPAAYSGSILHPLNLSEKLLALGAGCFPLFVQLYILFSLVRLFKLFERGVIFSMSNVRYIRNIGYALIATQIANALYQALMGFILTWRNPPGHRFSSITLDQTNIGVILVGLMVILISWIMLEGCKIREEQQLTV